MLLSMRIPKGMQRYSLATLLPGLNYAHERARANIAAGVKHRWALKELKLSGQQSQMMTYTTAELEAMKAKRDKRRRAAVKSSQGLTAAQRKARAKKGGFSKGLLCENQNAAARQQAADLKQVTCG